MKNSIGTMGQKRATYKMIVSYDGADFHGWQEQVDAPTITSTIQDTFYRVFGDHIHLLGASRTDSGVHAYHQVARFYARPVCSADTMKFALNNSLPASIWIRHIEEVPDSFDPRADVIKKIYWYHLFYRRPLPLFERYGWWSPFSPMIDWDIFYKAIQLYKGEHDFASFCTVEGNEQTVRRIDAVTFTKFSRYGVIRVGFESKGFVRYQIRRMVGYAFDVARRRDLSVDYIKSLLDNPDSRQHLMRAASNGLLLRKIVYGKGKDV